MTNKQEEIQMEMRQKLIADAKYDVKWHTKQLAEAKLKLSLLE